ncbi:hypothetical protein [Phaeobacter sp. B1627]|uniref:hypothetical protein n=1 Tax=Phaeobacter sp. B1627 TaxID=2583809 RepID=UPI00159ECE0E|nr:hypothetical protein [Phaeobacter sp. B1627]
MPVFVAPDYGAAKVVKAASPRPKQFVPRRTLWEDLARDWGWFDRGEAALTGRGFV